MLCSLSSDVWVRVFAAQERVQEPPHRDHLPEPRPAHQPQLLVRLPPAASVDARQAESESVSGSVAAKRRRSANPQHKR